MPAYNEPENYMVLPSALEHYYAGAMPRQDVGRSAYSETERRLYALPMLKERVQENREELQELENIGVEAARHTSSSLVRVLRPGMRLDPEEVHRTQVEYLRASVAADEREIKKLSAALSSISEDPYYIAVELKYIQGEKDADIAERICCDPTTVRRNRTRLVRKLAARLYGVW